MPLPQNAVLECGGLYIYVLHNLAELDLDPAAAGFHAVVSGHSHQPVSREKDGVLYVNPGSAGPRRFSLPIAVARLTIAEGRVSAEPIEVGLPEKVIGPRPTIRSNARCCQRSGAGPV